MSDGAGTTQSIVVPHRRSTVISRALKSPTVIISLLYLLFLLVVIVAPQLLASPQSVIDGDKSALLHPPSAAHWLGTDQLGRDLFSRIVHGARLTAGASTLAVIIATTGGLLIGLVMGYVGGWIDTVFMRFVDVLLSIPNLLLSMVIVITLGFSAVNVAIAVGFTGMASFARVSRAEAMRVKSMEYVESARVGGVNHIKILWRHILPNSVAPVIGLAVLEFGTAMLSISALSFLGFGAKPPSPEWGALVANGRDFVTTAWWLTIIPGLVIAITVLCVNRIAKAINDEVR